MYVIRVIRESYLTVSICLSGGMNCHAHVLVAEAYIRFPSRRVHLSRRGPPISSSSHETPSVLICEQRRSFEDFCLVHLQPMAEVERDML